MTNDEIANLTLEYLKRFDTRLERIENNMYIVKLPLGQLEQTVAHHTKRFDRLDERMERIEKPLDLVKA